MDKERYLKEIRDQYHLVCISLKNGGNLAEIEKGRFEGFMRAGLVLGVVTNKELQQVLEEIHFKVFGKSIAERRNERKTWAPEDAVDYGRYDSPAIGRVGPK